MHSQHSDTDSLLSTGLIAFTPQQILDWVSSSTDGACIVDSKWQIVLVGAHHKQIFGKLPDQLIGENLWDVFAHLRNSFLFDELNRAMREMVPVNFEHHFPTQNIWIETSAYPMPAGMLASFRNITERKNAEAAVRHSEERYRDLVENSGLLIGIHDREGKILSANQSALKYCGARLPEELLGKSIRDFLTPDVQHLFEDYLRKILTDGSAHGIMKIISPQGDERFFEYDNSLRTDGSAPIIRCLGRDVTEQKKAEAALARSEAQFRSLSESSPIGIFHADAEGLCTYTNSRFQEIFNLSETECLGHQWSQAIHPDDRDTVLKSWLEAVSEGRECNFEFRLLKPNNDIRYIRARKKPIPGSNGQQIGYVGTEEDITERKLAREQLTEQAALLNHAREAIIVTDPEGKIKFWNPGAEMIYGWTVKEATGIVGREIIFPKNIQRLISARPELIERGEWSEELTQTTKDGREIIVESHCSVILDEQHKHKLTLIINNDITEKKRLEGQYLRAQRLESIGALASGIAHDLNNLLSPMMMVEHILELKHTDAHSQQLLGTLKSSVQRASDLVNQVVSFARGTEGEKTTVNLKYLLQDIEKLFSETLPKSIQLQIESPSELWAIKGDVTQLYQVLINLSVNARDAMPRGGLLSISAENIILDESPGSPSHPAQPGKYIFVSVSDNGIGIPTENLDKIFDPFFTTKVGDRGTGLGLAMVQRIVSAHGGFIEVDSRANQGSIFKIFLPAESEPQSIFSQTTDQQIPMGHSELILVVDNEAAIREVTRETLELYGYQVLTSSEGTEAISVYSQLSDLIKAVILDAQVPNMQGKSIISSLLELNPDCVIIVTSEITRDEQGFNDSIFEVTQFLSKPFTAEKLLRTLAAVIK